MRKQLFLIYADNYIKWDKELNDWTPNDSYIGSHQDAFQYAYRKYGKYFTMVAEKESQQIALLQGQSPPHGRLKTIG